MINAKDLRILTAERRIELLKEAKEEVFNNIEREAKRGRNTYYFTDSFSYLDSKKFISSIEEMKEVIDELTELGYTSTK